MTSSRARRRSTAPATIGQLTPHPENPRQISAEALARLGKSMDRYGDLSGVVLNRRTGRLIGGHQRVKHIPPDAQIRMSKWLKRPTTQGTVGVGTIAVGGETFSYRVVDVDEQREREMLLAANAHGGTWDPAVLRQHLEALRAAGADFQPVGWTAEEVAELLAGGHHQLVSADPEPAIATPPKKPKSKPGQIYELGPHRLLCGDARKTDLVGQLVGEMPATVVYTDPPYGVDYQPHGRHRKMANDDRRRDNLAAFLTASLMTAVRYARQNAAFYIWHASATRADFLTALTAAGLEERQLLIWEKPSPGLGWEDYAWSHECCFYAAKAGQKPRFFGPKGQPTVFRLAPRNGTSIAVLVTAAGLLISDGHGTELYCTTQVPDSRKLRHVRLPPGGDVALRPAQERDDLWVVHRESGAEHPTQKPMALAKRAIANLSEPGDVVLDTFAGSGNTVLAADSLERRARLVELEPGYCDVIRQRFAEWRRDPAFSPVGKLRESGLGALTALSAS